MLKQSEPKKRKGKILKEENWINFSSYFVVLLGWCFQKLVQSLREKRNKKPERI